MGGPAWGASSHTRGGARGWGAARTFLLLHGGARPEQQQQDSGCPGPAGSGSCAQAAAPAVPHPGAAAAAAVIPWLVLLLSAPRARAPGGRHCTAHAAGGRARTREEAALLLGWAGLERGELRVAAAGPTRALGRAGGGCGLPPPGAPPGPPRSPKLSPAAGGAGTLALLPRQVPPPPPASPGGVEPGTSSSSGAAGLCPLFRAPRRPLPASSDGRRPGLPGPGAGSHAPQGASPLEPPPRAQEKLFLSHHRPKTEQFSCKRKDFLGGREVPTLHSQKQAPAAIGTSHICIEKP